MIIHDTSLFCTGELESDIHPQKITHPYEDVEQLSSLKLEAVSPTDGTGAYPPLPPKTYQCTSELIGTV